MEHQELDRDRTGISCLRRKPDFCEHLSEVSLICVDFIGEVCRLEEINYLDDCGSCLVNIPMTLHLVAVHDSCTQ